jgi:D-beta-D-heptose 7-phosphate kinase/D-beta-D-heptose 1-phosphate adenosyltransferase
MIHRRKDGLAPDGMTDRCVGPMPAKKGSGKGKKGKASPKGIKAERAPATKKGVRAQVPVKKEASERSGGISERLDGILDAFKESRVLVLGDLMMDRYIWGDVERISPEAPVPVVKASGEANGLGGACNVAANIRALGGFVVPMGLVGNDDDGKWLLEELARRGMETKYVLKDPNRRTTCKTRIIARNQQVVRIDREEVRDISGTLESALAGNVHSILGEVDAIVISDYAKGVVTPGLLTRVIRDARAAKKMVFVDPKPRNYRNYEGCTAITPNHHEAAGFVGPTFEKEGIMAIGKEVLRTLKCNVVLITRGKEGMSLFLDSGEVHHIQTVAREVYDVTGAGDTVMSAFALAACSGANWFEAATIANHAAGVVVRKLGAATLTVEDLRKEMSDKAGP